MEASEAIRVQLEPPWTSRIRGGIPEVPLEVLTQAARSVPLDAEAARVLLLDERAMPIAFARLDRPRGSAWIWPAEPEEICDAAFVESRLRRALALRLQAGLVRPTTAYRLCNGEGDGLAGVLIDSYAQHAVIYTLGDALLDDLPVLVEGLGRITDWTSIVSKVRSAEEVASGRIPFTLHAGATPDPRLQVEEDGTRYEVHLTGGLNTGLFPEMREVRRFLRPWFRDSNVLNLFAYTGSFSVVAAQAGAKSVATVDFASGVVEWSKTNFGLNDLPVTDPRFRFVKEDVFDFLKSSRRKDRRYDVVILDPPAATAVPGRRWFLKSDYGRLIEHTLEVMAPGSLLVVAASSWQSRPDKLETQIRNASREAGRPLQLLSSFGLPPDFPTQMIHPEGRFLKVFVLRVT